MPVYFSLLFNYSCNAKGQGGGGITHILNGYIKTDHQNVFLTMVENVLEKKYVEAYAELHQEEDETTS
jgi:hypothetical protein